MKTKMELEHARAESFICVCGSSLAYESRVNPETRSQEIRIACFKRFESKYFETVGCDEPGPWCATREEAEAHWKMVKVLTK